MNYLSSFFCSSFLWRAWQKFIKPGGKDLSASWRTETNPSKKSAGQRPSFFLKMSLLALAMAAWMSQQSQPEEISPMEKQLLSENWQPIESADCQNLEPGKLYSLENETESRELFVLKAEQLLISAMPLPEAPYFCHEIKSISNIKEI